MTIQNLLNSVSRREREYIVSAETEAAAALRTLLENVKSQIEQGLSRVREEMSIVESEESELER